jgi:enoyl-CoA hydratase
VVDTKESALQLKHQALATPIASMALVQVLRCTEHLPVSMALDVESFAYATLQAGTEHLAWKNNRKEITRSCSFSSQPLHLTRKGNCVEAVLSRPENRNSMSIEMRDAWIEALSLVDDDTSIESLEFSAIGPCFSVGGDLMEFGSTPNPAIAHWIRTVHSPARLLAKLEGRTGFTLHGACIGSGIELPAFSHRIRAHQNTFFQLPELQLGLIPGAGGTVSIARRIGRQRLAWLVISGKRIKATKALEWGLIDEVIN